MNGKIVVVTGSASGLGATCAEVLAQRGATVICVDHRDGTPPPGGTWETLDLTDLDAIAPAVERWVALHSRIDGLVNAAGVAGTKPFLAIEPQDFDRVFAINVRALFFVTQAVAASMVKTGGGSIVNFASTSARLGRPLASHYASSKGAVVTLTRSAALALGEHGIRVNAVAPGLIETPMLQEIRVARSELANGTVDAVQEEWERRIPLGRVGTTGDVADVVAFLLSDEARYVTGEDVGVHGGLVGP